MDELSAYGKGRERIFPPKKNRWLDGMGMGMGSWKNVYNLCDCWPTLSFMGWSMMIDYLLHLLFSLEAFGMKMGWERKWEWGWVVHIDEKV